MKTLSKIFKFINNNIVIVILVGIIIFLITENIQKRKSTNELFFAIQKEVVAIINHTQDLKNECEDTGNCNTGIPIIIPSTILGDSLTAKEIVLIFQTTNSWLISDFYNSTRELKDMYEAQTNIFYNLKTNPPKEFLESMSLKQSDVIDQGTKVQEMTNELIEREIISFDNIMK
jgi:hypothetical protein